MGKYSWFGGDFEARYESYIDELTTCLGHADRHKPFKSYCTGLLLPVDRKSVEPIAAHVDPTRTSAAHQSLLHFVGYSKWSHRDLLASVRNLVLPVMTAHSPVIAWTIDDTGFPKQGKHSVGVGRQYCGQLGKQDNCQAAVSLSVSTKDASLPIAWRLYLPEAWANDPERRASAKVPEDVIFQTKTDIALDQIQQIRADGVTPAPLLADAGYGKSAAFRDALDAMGQEYIVAIMEKTSLWRPGHTPTVPTHGGPGRQPKNLIRNAGDNNDVAQAGQWVKSLFADGPNEQWQEICWRDDAHDDHKLKLTSRFWRTRVRVASGDQKRQVPRAEQWLIVEWPHGTDKPSHYWLSNLPQDTDFKSIIFLAKHRWRIEEDYLNLKQDCGLADYEGRGWPGFHNHCALSIAAYAFLVAEKVTFPPSRQRTSDRHEKSGLPQGPLPRTSARHNPKTRAKLYPNLAQKTCQSTVQNSAKMPSMC